jgi:5'-nucleotidase (lipoprotein e(P4) family)
LQNTLKNLASEGFPNADTSFVFLKKDTSDKTRRRKTVAQNYEVLLFIGDNLTDFSQLYAHRGPDLGFSHVDENKDEFGARFFMLPNPMYGEWEGAIYGNDFSLSAMEKRKRRKQGLKGY